MAWPCAPWSDDVRWIARSAPRDIDDRLREGLRRFLRQVVADAARDGPVLVLAAESLGVGTRIRARCAIGIALQGNGRHGDVREFGELLFQRVELGFTLGQPAPPAIIVDDDGGVIRVAGSRGAAIEGGVV